MRQTITQQYITWGLFAIAIIAYLLPWTVNIGNSITLGAYDFAEWLGKGPFDDTSYNTILLLRGQLVILTWFIMLSSKRPYFTLNWWACLIVGLILVIAQFPPIEFINNTGDINQQQQAILTIIALISLPIGASAFLSPYRNITWLIIAIIGLASTIFALINAINMMKAYNLAAQIGIGAIIFSLVYAILGLIAIRGFIKHCKTKHKQGC
jgi:hypothetical protein